MVDTDVWIDFLRGYPKAVAFVKKLPDDRVWIDAVSVAELYMGVRDGAEREALDQLLSTLEVADVTGSIAARGGLLRRDMGRSHGVGLNDALIAATALELNLAVQILNTKHYPMLASAELRRAYLKL